MKNAKKSKAKNQKTLNIFKYVALSLGIITTIILILLTIALFRFDILPTKIVIPIVVFFVFIATVVILFSLIKKSSLAYKIVSIAISVITSIIGVFGLIKLEDTIHFFSDNFGVNESISIYNIMVASDSTLSESSDLSTLKVHVYRDLTADSDVILQELSSGLKIRDTHFAFDNTIPELIEFAKTSPDNLIAVNAGAYDAYLSDNEEDKDTLKTLTTVEIKTDAEIVEKNLDVTNNPFIVYVSGIDTRLNALPDRSLSDVNIVAVINPLVKKMLLVAIPRDYYVHIPGSPDYALNDKLTHAGTIGGVQLSKKAVSEILDIDIDYYVRVNFNFVQNLVDAVGGITIDSDVDYSFSCWTDRGCIFYPGENYVNGRCALAFARERHAYSTGDKHRGENQEQVISKIIGKLTSSKTILSSYSDILNALSGTFETDLTADDFTKFAKAQLNDMKGWQITNSNLDGTTGGAYTYSYPEQALSVMYPNEESIAIAKQKIIDLLAE